ncbi:MAG: HAMP domain-containing sensor histidine kinase [Bacteroidales bacterium]|nr:HAMP domain-containing sensor histidine kinase [Bacteroidales bacterium]MDY6411449.1 HAMP domain-containing sensor histidine kinase [Bacteroidales bacterium]
MKKSTIWILTIVMAVALLGLLFVQIMYIENMIKMRNEQFSEVVMRSLYNVATNLERDETKYFLDQDLNEAQASLIPFSSTGVSKNGFGFNKSTPFDTTGSLRSDDKLALGDDDNLSGLGARQSRQEILKGQYLYQKGLLNEVILSILNHASDRPISERADSATVQHYIEQELQINGLSMPFEFAVTNSSQVYAYLTSGYEASVDNNKSIYSQILFPNDPNGKYNTLNVTFPTKGDYIFSSIKFMLPSFFFTFILMAVFIYTIILAFRQKKISEMKNDFINNMTHEFKTPISSISLAAQMLNDEAVTKSPVLLKQAATVITDETKRLRFQVEKVLQMSMFDRTNATMKLQEVDVDAVVYSVVNTFKLKVEKFGGSISAELNSEDPIVNVDEMHFTNVIFNLLDNAIKYRREDVAPQLKVTTSNPDDNHVIITVEDNGIGIKREDLKKIFEKFYRVSTGNRHDVKGFGLGLAYVHKMITLFGGTIKAESEMGKGSKFIITLPLLK